MKVKFNWRDYDDYSKWLIDVLTTLTEDNEVLQSKIDKAIEYIQIELSQGGERELRDLVDGYELLDILKGEDK